MILHQFAEVQFDNAIRESEVAIVVRDHDHRLAPRLEVGKYAPVKGFLELRILAGGPFVEQVEGAVFEVAGEQRQALALAL